jgi:hypothetical protein
MTEPTPATNVAPEPADQPQPDDSATNVAPDTDEPESANHREARYRTELRAVQAERDAMAEQLGAYRRDHCQRVVADLLEQPADLWQIGQADPSAFFNDAGELDETELRAAAGALVDERPRLARPRGPRHENFGQFTQAPPPKRIGWNEVIGG